MSGELKAKSYDPFQSYLTPPRTGLSGLFKPRSIAIVGATDRPGSVAGTIIDNLKPGASNFKIYPINPTKTMIKGYKAYPSVVDVEDDIDLAVVVTPSKTVPAIMKSLGEKKIGVAVVISAGFKEIGEEGLALEQEVVRIAKEMNIRLVGPNCLGVMNPNYMMNATFASCMAKPGNIAFISQSGAMCTAVLDWSLRSEVGFSAFVSIGSMAEVNWGDLISYLGNDPETQSILCYMETIGDAKAFLSAAKEVAINKPMIVIKAGRTQAAAEAAASHTGSLAGSHDAFIAAMRRVGVLTVETISELFNCALVLSKMPRPTGPGLLVVTNAGGPGVLSTDATELAGGEITPLDEDSKVKLDKILPSAWSHANPVDVLGDASAELYAKTLEICMHEKNSHGVLVVLSPQSVTEPTKTAEELVKIVEKTKAANGGVLPKPVLASWMGGSDVREGTAYLDKHGIPVFGFPDEAARTFSLIWKQTGDLGPMHEMPGVETPMTISNESMTSVKGIISKARTEKRELLTEAESKDLLKHFQIPIVETIVCETKEAAVKASENMGYPCVVKLHSEVITHKSDVGGVRLNISSKEGVAESWDIIKANVDKINPAHFQGVTVQPMINLSEGVELILGSVVDNQFGPLVLFGSGGCFVEVYQDTCLGIPPLNATLAARMIENTKISKALLGGHGERFPGVDMNALKKLLVSFSQMIAELADEVSEIDINPLLATPKRLISLDARVVLRDKSEDMIPLSIRPYPREYMFSEKLKNGQSFEIRPAHPNDYQKLWAFHESLSASTIKMRWLRDLQLDSDTIKSSLTALCFADPSRLITLLAIKDDKVLGTCRIRRLPTHAATAEFNMLVADQFQKQGLGRLFMGKLLEVCKLEQMTNIRAVVSTENVGFLKMVAENKFSQTKHATMENVVVVEKQI